MASVNKLKLESNKLLERRRSSAISHINRIRDANSKRQFATIWADLEKDSGKSKSVKSFGKSTSASVIKEKTSHENCVSYRSVKRFGSERFDVEDKEVKEDPRTSSKKIETPKKVKRRRSSVTKKESRKRSSSREPVAKSQSLSTKKSISTKVLAQDDVRREFSKKPMKAYKRRSSKNVKVKTKLKPKTVRSKTRKALKVVKRDQKARKKLNENEYSESNLFDSDKDSEDSADDMVADDAHQLQRRKTPQKTKKKTSKALIKSKKSSENKYLERHTSDSDQDSRHSDYDILANAANLKKPVTSKDIIVLKWLHKMKCPESGKSDASGESLFSKGDQKYPIEILKKPSTIKVKRERYADVLDENNNSKSLESHPSIEHVSLEGIAARSIYSENVNFQARESKEYQQIESKDSSRHVEMRVTELGKLHIVLNLKSLSPEDSAVIVWLDDLPRSDMKPDYKRRLSISSLQNLQLQKQPSVLKSHSSQALEDEPSPKPNIFFPSVTILKNLAVDSKGKLRSLKIDSSDSVFYKRCNISHSEDLLQF